ncbi:MAG: hypothetical protein ACREN8_06710, partial [Candidatus Dormibacteraceae bacterium]
YSLLRGDGTGFGHVEVRKPAPGSWTAVIFAKKDDKRTKYTGAVKFTYFGQRFQSVAGASPEELRLGPGEHGNISVSMPASTQPGDTAASLHLSTGGGNDGSIPVLLRALLPQSGKFSGTLTGGADSQGQQFAYQFDLPGGQPSLNLGLTLHDPNYNLLGALVDPHGEPLDIQSTQAGSNPDIFGSKLQFFHLQPDGGRWTLVLQVVPPTDGSRLSEPFEGQFDSSPPNLNVSGIPNSAATVLSRGKAVTATVKVFNRGLVKKGFLADARLGQRSQLALVGAGTNNLRLPLSPSSSPSFNIPPGTDQAVFSAKSSVPINMVVSPSGGDPNRLGGAQPNNAAVATISDPEVAPGQWYTLPGAVGPFPDGGGGKAAASVTATVDTYPFDSAISASSGDAWAKTVNSSAPSTPLLLDPGGSGTITLTITPNAASGTIVRGFIGIDTYNSYTQSGDEVGLISYTYQVG